MDGDYLRHLAMLPKHMREPMQNYIERGYPVGEFLRALLSNNLRRTFETADDVNQGRILDFLRYLYLYCPANCWGSPENVSAWQQRGGLLGK